MVAVWSMRGRQQKGAKTMNKEAGAVDEGRRVVGSAFACRFRFFASVLSPEGRSLGG